MPTQTVPLQGLDQVGLVIDSPSITLPENAFSDANNVRFDDGAIRKVRGFQEIFADPEESPTAAWRTDIQYIAYWPNPNQPIWVVVNRENLRDNIYTVTIDSDGVTQAALRSASGGYTISQGWQHTIFNGGYSFIINNGIDRPQHLTVQQGIDLGPGDLFQDLPGWDSYNSGSVQANNLRVSASKVVAFGSLLMAGGLLEVDTSNSDRVVRNLRGVVRSSSVAPLGDIPRNWDPFATGAGTADELLIADTGEITAMAPLQGNMMVYTSDSITRVSVSNQGLSETNITREYGATSIGSVFEYDGRHVVQGSNDIYIFEGHPASIQSISDGRVRRFYYEDVHGSFTDRTRIVRNQTFDEIWVCYVSNSNNFGRLDTALTWNYRNNIWSRRSLPDLSAIAVGPIEGGGIDTEEFIFAVPSPRTVTGTSVGAVAEVQRAAMVAGSVPAGTLEVQSSAQTGTRSNVATGQDEIFTLSLPSNFQSAASATTSGTFSFTLAPQPSTSGGSETRDTSNFGGVSGLTVRHVRGRSDAFTGALGTTQGRGQSTSAVNYTVSAADSIIQIIFDTSDGGGTSGGGTSGFITVSGGILPRTQFSGQDGMQNGNPVVIRQYRGPAWQDNDGGLRNLQQLPAGTVITVESSVDRGGSVSTARRANVISRSDTYSAIYSGDVNILPTVGGVAVGTSRVTLGNPINTNQYVVTTDRRSNSANAPAAATPASAGQSTTADATDFAGFTGLTVRHTRTRSLAPLVVRSITSGNNDPSVGITFGSSDRTSTGTIAITAETSFARVNYADNSGAASLVQAMARGPAWVNGDSGLGLTAAQVAALPMMAAGTSITGSETNGGSLLFSTTGRATRAADTFSDAYSARYTGSSSVAITIGSLSPVTSTFQNIGQPTNNQFTVTSSGSSATAPTGDNSISNFGGVTGLTVRRDSDGNNIGINGITVSGGGQVADNRSNISARPVSLTFPAGVSVNVNIPFTILRGVQRVPPADGVVGNPYQNGEYRIYWGGQFIGNGQGNFDDNHIVGWILSSGSGLTLSANNGLRTSFSSRTTYPTGNNEYDSVFGQQSYALNFSNTITSPGTGFPDPPANVGTSMTTSRFDSTITISGTTTAETTLQFFVGVERNDPTVYGSAPGNSTGWTGTVTSEAYFGRFTGSGVVTVGGTSVGSSDTRLPLPVGGQYNVDTGQASTFTINLDTGNVGVFPNVVGGVFAGSINRATAYNQIASSIVNEYPSVTTSVVSDVLQIDTNQERNLAGSAVITAGNGGVNTSPTFNSSFTDGILTLEGSIYTIFAPDGTEVGSFTSSVTAASESDLPAIQTMATTLINGYSSADGEVDSSTVDTSISGEFEITNGVTGPVDGVWSITAVHPPDPEEGGTRTGDIAFAAFTEDTAGVDGGAFDVTVTLPGATEALDTVTITNNTTGVVDGLDLVRSGVNNAITDNSWTAAGTGTNLDLTRATGGNQQGLFSVALSNSVRGTTLPTVNAFAEQTQGRDATVAGRLTLTEISPTGVRFTFYDQSQTGQTAAQVAAIARTEIAARDAFSVTGSGTSAGVQTTAFGPSAPTIEVVATLGTFLDLSNGVASTDASIVSISQLQTRDLERPWPTTFINEGFNFVVGASRLSDTVYNVVAFDVGYSEMGNAFVSYVERKNIHVRPTKETESIRIVFIDAEGDVPLDTTNPENNSTFDVRLRTTNAAGQADRVDLSQDSADNESYTFIYRGDMADYKTDVRLTGRILNYRIEDNSGQDWSIAELGLEIGEGGTR